MIGGSPFCYAAVLGGGASDLGDRMTLHFQMSLAHSRAFSAPNFLAQDASGVYLPLKFRQLANVLELWRPHYTGTCLLSQYSFQL